MMSSTHLEYFIRWDVSETIEDVRQRSFGHFLPVENLIHGDWETSVLRTRNLSGNSPLDVSLVEVS